MPEGTVVSEGSGQEAAAGKVALSLRGLALFIVDKQGRVRWSYVGKDAADRPDDQLIIEQLKR